LEGPEECNREGAPDGADDKVTVGACVGPLEGPEECNREGAPDGADDKVTVGLDDGI